MSKPLKGRDLDAYIRANTARQDTVRQDTSYGQSLRTTDTVARAKVEHDAMMAGVLAVLICWFPFATVITLVAGLGSWSVARRGWQGNAGAFATCFSAAVIVAWMVVITVNARGY